MCVVFHPTTINERKEEIKQIFITEDEPDSEDKYMLFTGLGVHV